MKIFRSIDRSDSKGSNSWGGAKVKSPKKGKFRQLKKIRSRPSDSEIRDKFEKRPGAKLKTGPTKLSRPPSAQKGQPETTGDVSGNNPADSMTHEKLKGILTMGGFSFSDKEKAVLDKILV